MCIWKKFFCSRGGHLVYRIFDLWFPIVIICWQIFQFLSVSAFLAGTTATQTNWVVPQTKELSGETTLFLWELMDRTYLPILILLLWKQRVYLIVENYLWSVRVCGANIGKGAFAISIELKLKLNIGGIHTQQFKIPDISNYIAWILTTNQPEVC